MQAGEVSREGYENEHDNIKAEAAWVHRSASEDTSDHFEEKNDLSSMEVGEADKIMYIERVMDLKQIPAHISTGDLPVLATSQYSLERLSRNCTSPNGLRSIILPSI